MMRGQWFADLLVEHSSAAIFVAVISIMMYMIYKIRRTKK